MQRLRRCGTDAVWVPLAQDAITLCAPLANAANYNDRTVIVHAWVRDNGMDMSTLVHPACTNRVVKIRWAPDAQQGDNLKALRVALFKTGAPGTVGKEISGDFVGVFSETPAAEQDWIVGQLTLRDVQRLSVKLIPPPKQ